LFPFGKLKISKARISGHLQFSGRFLGFVNEAQAEVARGKSTALNGPETPALPDYKKPAAYKNCQHEFHCVKYEISEFRAIWLKTVRLVKIEILLFKVLR
jgi:hypothetical protein